MGKIKVIYEFRAEGLCISDGKSVGESLTGLEQDISARIK